MSCSSLHATTRSLRPLLWLALASVASCAGAAEPDEDEETGGRGGAAGGQAGAPGGSGGTAGSTPRGGSGGGSGGAGGQAESGRGGSSEGGSSGGAAGGKAGAGAGGASPGGGAGGGGGGASGQGGTPAAVGRPFVYVGSGQREGKIFVYELDTQTKKLRQVQRVDGQLRPSYMAWLPGDSHVFASNEDFGNNSKVKSFAVNPTTGLLTLVNERSVKGSDTAHVALHPTGRWLFAAHHNSADTEVFPVAEDGKIGESVGLHPSGRRSHQVLFDKTGRYVFVCSREDKKISQFVFDAVSGTLTANNPPAVSVASDPRHLAFHPTAAFAYAVAEQGTHVIAFSYDATKGTLTELQKVTTASPEKWAGHIEVSPNGKFVYASGRDTNAIYVFSVNTSTGQLTAAGKREGMGVARDFGIDETGRYMIVAGGHAYLLGIGDDGALSLLDDVDADGAQFANFRYLEN